ncbi:MAG: hypothetical protein HY042_07700, partial [Spirochaetia bacterium]|nr:hypothetical protein [Spirochaetia bacterium]
MRWLNRLSPVILLGAGLFLVFMAAACQKLPPRPPVDLLDSDQDLSELERSHETWTRAPDVPNFGFGRHSIWLRLPAANPGNTRREYVLEVAAPWVDRIEFSLTGGGTTGTAGVTVPFASDSFFHRHPSFAFSLAPGESRTVYVRAVHWGLLSLPLRLWDKAEFEKKVQGEYALHGMYFGAILALLLYNLTLFFIVRDQSYL